MTNSPASAYRADTSVQGAVFGAHDDSWLAAANVLHLAARAIGTTRQHLLFDALGVAIDLLGDERIEAAVERDYQGHPSHIDALLVLTDLMHTKGALNLSAAMLDDLLIAATGISALTRGRILTLRSRVAWKLGELDDAVERYLYIASLGKRSRLPELVARAHLGLGAVAQLRGNYPAMAEHSRSAARIADRRGLTTIARFAHYGLMLGQAKAGRFDEALLEGWKVLDLSRGDAELEAGALQNIGQVLFEAGHVDGGRACFAAVVERRPSIRIILPALGGLALASAKSGFEATVEWAVREIWAAQRATAPHHELASALIECAAALVVLGRNRDAARYRAAGERLAAKYGFHELQFKAEALRLSELAPKTPVKLRAPAARVVRKLAALEPERLPKHVIESAPA